MPRMDFIVMTKAQKDKAMALDGEDAMLGARRITRGRLRNKWVVPARILEDPSYERWRDVLSGIDIKTLDSTTLFAQPKE